MGQKVPGRPDLSSPLNDPPAPGALTLRKAVLLPRPSFGIPVAVTLLVWRTMNETTARLIRQTELEILLATVGGDTAEPAR